MSDVIFFFNFIWSDMIMSHKTGSHISVPDMIVSEMIKSDF